GDPGFSDSPGVAGQAGGDPSGMAYPGGPGGDGGDSGWPGRGTAGSAGGSGSGGAGGTIAFSASYLAGGSATVDTSGGALGYQAGGNGRLLLFNNSNAGISGLTLIKATVNDGSTVPQPGPRRANPFLANNAATPYIPGAQNGPDIFSSCASTSSVFPTVFANN